MSLFAIIDYGLILIFFIVLITLLLLFVRSDRRAVTSTPLPSPREEPVPYAFLAVLFLLFIILTVVTQKGRRAG
jgi:hypothetical protein